jgi:hypothetical protein
VGLLTGGYTLHYFDELTGEHVSMPIENIVEAKFPDIAAARGDVIVTYDEVGTFTREVVEKLTSLRPLWHERDLERAMTPGDETADRRVAWLDVDYSDVEVRALAQGALVVGADFDACKVMRMTARPELDKLAPLDRLEKRRPDWQDRGPQHKNRKKRSWR